MAEPLNKDLAELFVDELIVYPFIAQTTGFGAKSTKLKAFVYPARIVGRTRRVRDATGTERVSTVQAVVNGAHDLKVEDRFKLPPRFVPREPRAIAVERQVDENGPHHETVYF